MIGNRRQTGGRSCLQKAFSMSPKAHSTHIILWLSGALWALSWIGMLLEIFHWHHLTPTLKLKPPPSVPGWPEPVPGNALLSLLCCSVIAPFLFLICLLKMTSKKGEGKRRDTSRSQLPKAFFTQANRQEMKEEIRFH